MSAENNLKVKYQAKSLMEIDGPPLKGFIRLGEDKCGCLNCNTVQGVRSWNQPCDECGMTAEASYYDKYDSVDHIYNAYEAPAKQALIEYTDDTGKLQGLIYHEEFAKYKVDLVSESKMQLTPIGHDDREMEYNLQDHQVYTRKFGPKGLVESKALALSASKVKMLNGRVESWTPEQISGYYHNRYFTTSRAVSPYSDSYMTVPLPMIRSIYDRIAVDEYGAPSRQRLDFDMRGADLMKPNGTMYPQEYLPVLCVQYPAVMNKEKQRLEENLSYTDVAESMYPRERIRAYFQTAEDLSQMDRKLSVDLHKAEKPEQVDQILKSVTFGEKSESQLPTERNFDSEKSYGGKWLHKQYNVNPYRTASNVRTLQKLGVRDINDVQTAFKEASNKNGYIRSIDTQGAMRLSKLMIKNRGDAIAGVKALNVEGADGESIWWDTILLYEDVTRTNKICGTKDEIKRASLIDTRNRVRRYKDEHPDATLEEMKSDEAWMKPFHEAWGESTDECLSFICEQVKEQPERETPMLRCRNNKLLFDRSVKQIHEELVSMRNRTQEEVEDISYDAETKSRYDKTINGYRFYLPKTTEEMYDCGVALDICVYSYRHSVMRGNTTVIAMENPSQEYVGCFEVSNNQLIQAKGYKNTPIVDGVAEAKQYIDGLGLDGMTERAQRDYDAMGRHVEAQHGFHMGAAPIRISSKLAPIYVVQEAKTQAENIQQATSTGSEVLVKAEMQTAPQDGIR